MMIKDIADAIAPAKVKEVGSVGIRKGLPKKLPLAYYSSYVVWLTELDDKLFEDKLLIFEFVFTNFECEW